jgi:enoyl-CoA hydratase
MAAYAETEEDGVGTVWLDNGRLNLLTDALRRDIVSSIQLLGANDDVRSIVVASRGRQFCAGADLHEVAQRFSPAVALSHLAAIHEMALSLRTARKPVVAAINGACLGGGLEIALACDFRVCSPTASLGLPEVSRGLWPATGGLFQLQRVVGHQEARRMVLQSKIHTASEALLIGLVDEVSLDADCYQQSRRVALGLAKQPAVALQSARELLDLETNADFRAHLTNQTIHFLQIYQSRDAWEGIDAFLKKRAPNWTHR